MLLVPVAVSVPDGHHCMQYPLKIIDRRACAPEIPEDPGDSNPSKWQVRCWKGRHVSLAGGLKKKTAGIQAGAR